MLKLKEVAKYLDVHTNTVYKMIKEGLPHYKVGKEFRFKIEEVEAWLKNKED